MPKFLFYHDLFEGLWTVLYCLSGLLCCKHSQQENNLSLSGEHVREGLTCVISVKVPNPEFEGQTKVTP